MTTDWVSAGCLSLSALDGITWKRQLKTTCAPKPSLAFWAPRHNEEEAEAGRKATQLGRNAATTDYDGGLRWGRREGGDVRCYCCMLVREKHGLAASVASERYYTSSARSQRIAHCSSSSRSSSNRVWPKEKAASAVPFIVLLVVVAALAEDFLYFRLPRNGPVLAITAGLHAEKKVVCVYSTTALERLGVCY